MKTVKEIKIVCNSCERKLLMNDVEVLSKVQCPNCRAKVIVPLIVGPYALMTEDRNTSSFKSYKGVVIETGKEVFAFILSKDKIDTITDIEKQYSTNENVNLFGEEEQKIICCRNSELYTDIENLLQKLLHDSAKANDAKKNIVISTKNKRLRQRKQRKNSSAGMLITLCLLLGVSAIGYFIYEKSNTSMQEVREVKKSEEIIKPEIKQIKKVVKILPRERTVPVIKKPEAPKEVIEKKKTPEEMRAVLNPADYEFDDVFDDFYEYTKTFEPEIRGIEEKRMKLITYFKDTLLIPLINKGYSGPVLTKDQKPFIGQLIKADEDTVHMMNSKSMEENTFQWQDFKFEQFNEFINYFATLEIDSYKLGDNTDESFTRIARFHELLAVVAAWYDQQELSLRHRAQALSYAPALTEELNAYFN